MKWILSSEWRRSSCAVISHRNNNLPLRMTCSQVAHGFGNFLQRIYSIQNRLDLSAFEHILQKHEVLTLETCYQENDLLARFQRRQLQLDDMAERSDPAVGLWSSSSILSTSGEP